MVDNVFMTAPAKITQNTTELTTDPTQLTTHTHNSRDTDTKDNYNVIEYWLVMKNKSSKGLDQIELGVDTISLKCVKHMKTVYQDENSVVQVENSVE